MRHEFQEGEEAKNPLRGYLKRLGMDRFTPEKEVSGRLRWYDELVRRQLLGVDPGVDPDEYDIDPADFFDPEEFGFRRRGEHDPRP